MADGGSVDGKGIGARVPRKEDARHLAGKGKFTSDFKRPGQKDMAFVRSPDNISIELLQEGDPLPPAEPWASMENTGSW